MKQLLVKRFLEARRPSSGVTYRGKVTVKGRKERLAERETIRREEKTEEGKGKEAG